MPTRLIIRIELPANRDYTGAARLLDEQGKRLAGPLEVCGRTSDDVAADHGNPTRTTTLPYGDPPLGVYRVSPLLPTGAGTEYDAGFYGQQGAFALAALTGDAAIARQNGAPNVLLHGGPPSPEGYLCATAGGLRVSDADLRILIDAIEPGTEVFCQCVPTAVSAGESFFVEDGPVWDFNALPLEYYSTNDWSTSPPAQETAFISPPLDPPPLPVEGRVEDPARPQPESEMLLEDPLPPAEGAGASTPGVTGAYDE